jgi:DNA-directed RNA polymerase specialized sigma24 family protein
MRLEAWAAWANEKLRAYPAQTIIARVMAEGLQGACIGSDFAEMPEAVAITDAAVSKLRDIERRCIVEYYLRWEPKELIAARLNMPWERLKRLLRDARIRIQSFIASAEGKFEESFKRV